LISIRNPFVTVLEAKKAKIQVPLDSESSERLFSGSLMAPCSCALNVAERERQLAQASFVRVLASFMRVHTKYWVPT
jgi:hypothetical protein